MSRATAAAVLCGLLMCACSDQELYGKLTQQQANEMVAVLRNAGIDADKQTQEGGTFAITAPHDSFSRAVEVLRAQGYPRDEHDSLGQVFKKEGFVSSPLEEQARLNHALSQEISTTLSSIDGVVMARVHLSLPEKDPLAEKAPPASASVFIKYRAGVDLSGQVGNIKALVVNSIQSLSYDNVTVALFPAEPWSAPEATSKAGFGRLSTALWWCLGLGGAVLMAGSGLWALQRRRHTPPRPAKPRLITLSAAPAHIQRKDDSHEQHYVP
ncbi:MAG TPA: type III secretion inner membrane ring lipoprotein SctJ [Burkholderiaceae bacterium]|nr:type III secretion inner membrane ring lipoprotein SctJ [Burkholderiaceae bacterium]